MYLRERVEDEALLVGGDADARVLHGDSQSEVVRSLWVEGPILRVVG